MMANRTARRDREGPYRAFAVNRMQQAAVNSTLPWARSYRV